MPLGLRSSPGPCANLCGIYRALFAFDEMTVLNYSLRVFATSSVFNFLAVLFTCSQNPPVHPPAALPDQYRSSPLGVTLVAPLIARLEKNYFNRTIAVLDFSSSDGRYSQLGPWLADQSSVALAHSPNLMLVDRARVHATLERAGLQPGDSDSLKNLERLARQLDADVLIRGWFVPSANGLSLSLSAVAFKPEVHHIGNTFNEVRSSPEIEALAGGPLEDSKIALLPKARPGSGLSFPQCSYCPNPIFTRDARDAKFSGTLSLELTVTPKGRATDIEVLRYVGYGLEREVIRTVQSWRFTPARDSSGHPVAVRVPVEIILRLL